MRPANKIILLIFLISLISQISYSQDCKTLPTIFDSYQQATRLVKSSKFKIKETLDTSKSSWIRGATYYSCDGEEGFLILVTDDKEYIHQNVPINVWNGFKNASSFGSYYSRNIKGKYQLQLNI
ncbi:MAG: KTSC domain-containing protein [Deltaproteobacteria bacterium]|nr:KTSC domain-containing protein [Deltaproteobacteria bacterium]